MARKYIMVQTVEKEEMIEGDFFDIKDGCLCVYKDRQKTPNGHLELSYVFAAGTWISAKPK